MLTRFFQRLAAIRRERPALIPADSRSLQERYPQYTIGRGSYGGLEVKSWSEGATLSVGAYCSFAEDVRVLLGGEHRTDWVTTYPFTVLWPAAAGISGHPKTKGDVRIGHDVWIGEGSRILSGITIGNGAVIGAGSVVTKNVAPYEIVAGNPARHIRNRFSPEVAKLIEATAWWNWSERAIGDALPHLLSNDIGAFLRYFEEKNHGA